MDVIAPSITLINPQVDGNRGSTITVNKTLVDLYGKVQDSSGVASLTVNKKSAQIEDDGLFVSTLEAAARYQ
ncbi:MAG: hypothetical protein ABJA79_07785 [Parafilimonas sp.]